MIVSQCVQLLPEALYIASIRLRETIAMSGPPQQVDALATDNTLLLARLLRLPRREWFKFSDANPWLELAH